MREHGHVAAVDSEHRGTHALRNEVLQLRVDGVIVVAQDVVAGLRLLSGAGHLLVEQVCDGHALRRPDELLFFW